MSNYVKWMMTTHASYNLLAECGSDNLVALKPELVISDLSKNYPGYLHYRCPAFIDAMKNTYVVKAPFDFSIKIDPAERNISADKDQDFIQKYLHDRKTDYVEGQNMLMSVNHFMLFITDDDIEIEQMPCLYHHNDWTSKTQVVTGKFNIMKWIRPIEIAAIIPNTKPNNSQVIINIKRGDALFYIRLHPKNKQHVTLEQEVDFNKIVKYIELTWSTSQVKRTNPFLKLPVLYNLFERFRPKKFFKKCPFNFRR